MSGLGDDGIWLRFRLAGIDGYPFLHALLKTDVVRYSYSYLT